MKAALAVILIVLSLGVLEAARNDVVIEPLSIGATPVTKYAQANAQNEIIFILCVWC